MSDDTHKVVPREPTATMKAAGDAAWNDSDSHDDLKVIAEIWRAMYDVAPTWIPVSERLPTVALTKTDVGEYSDEVVVYAPGWGRSLAKRWWTPNSSHSGWTGYWFGTGSDAITHWMPLPAAPMKEEGRG